MDSVGKPRGLIRYTSSHHDATGQFHVIRPRTIGYGIVWLAALAAFVALVVHHAPLRFDLLRDRHALYREMADGSIENLYTLKVTNEDQRPHRFRIKAEFHDGTPLTVTPDFVDVDVNQTQAVTLTLRTSPRDDNAPRLPMVEKVEVELQSVDDPSIEREHVARFLTGEH
jgi:polyferredoxin